MVEPLTDRPGRSAGDEKRLVDGLLAGSAAARSELLERTHHPVYCMACRLTRDPELRRDWCHSALLGIVDDLERGGFVYRRPGGFWAWFRKRVHYRLLDEYRRSRRLSARESAVEELETLPFASEPGDDPAARMQRVEFLGAVESCLAKLASGEQRRAVRLLVLEDLGYQDIADAMAAPLNTVRAWIRRGRLALRRCLAVTLGLEPAGAVHE